MIIRYMLAVTSGTFMTLSLFYVMQTLIAMGPYGEVTERDRFELGFARVIEDKPVTPKPPTPVERLKEPVDRPPPVTLHDDFSDYVGVRLERPDNPNARPDYGIGSFLSDGPLVAIVRVQPTYPARAADRGLEGWVIVQFDVNSEGLVTNAFVVDSSNSIFNDAAVKAAIRFRYKARVVDGTPLATHGVQNKFTFEMDRG